MQTLGFHGNDRSRYHVVTVHDSEIKKKKKIVPLTSSAQLIKMYWIKAFLSFLILVWRLFMKQKFVPPYGFHPKCEWAGKILPGQVCHLAYFPAIWRKKQQQQQPAWTLASVA